MGPVSYTYCNTLFTIDLLIDETIRTKMGMKKDITRNIKATIKKG
jgi:hypothetical protein